MTLKSLFSFQGRFSRSQFWLWGVGLPSLIGVLCIGFIVAAMFLVTDPDDFMPAFLVMGILYLPLAFIGMACAVKRLHDLDRSGWWYLLTVIPLVNVGFAIWIGAFKGTSGPNQYGNDPLGNITQKISSIHSRWLLVGVSGQYKGCEFPFDEDLTFGTNPKLCSVVFDKRQHPSFGEYSYKLRHPNGPGEPRLLSRDFDSSNPGGGWGDRAIHEGRIDLGDGQIFQLKPFA